MAVVKENIEYRYLFDIASGKLHDLKSEKNPDSSGCKLEEVEDWVCFDAEKRPKEGIVIRKLTKTKEVVDIEVSELCRHCMSAEDGQLVDMLNAYFLENN